MTQLLDEVVHILTLDPIADDRFLGQTVDIGWRMVFGGQVLGQSLAAAMRTVPSTRPVHSLHAYFMRPGDPTKPIAYQVERLRDGGSFTTRGVMASQGGPAIFTMTASFQSEEPGLEHQDVMPDVPPPEAVACDGARIRAATGELPSIVRAERPFEARTVEGHTDFPTATARPARRLVWFRAAGSVPDEQPLHRRLLAYFSDFGLLSTALLPHGVLWRDPTLQIASLDHAMWFHGDAKVDEWMLYAMDSPAATGGRGLVRGRIFTRGGRLIASVAQEGMIRCREC